MEKVDINVEYGEYIIYIFWLYVLVLKYSRHAGINNVFKTVLMFAHIKHYITIHHICTIRVQLYLEILPLCRIWKLPFLHALLAAVLAIFNYLSWRISSCRP